MFLLDVYCQSLHCGQSLHWKETVNTNNHKKSVDQNTLMLQNNLIDFFAGYFASKLVLF